MKICFTGYFLGNFCIFREKQLVTSKDLGPGRLCMEDSSTLQIWLKFICGLKLVCGAEYDCSGYLFTPVYMNLPAIFVSISEFVQRDQSKT